jgi:SAM-dependent methyltransferase
MNIHHTLFADVLNGDDVRVIELGYCLRLAHETRIRIPRQGRALEHLEGHDAVQGLKVSSKRLPARLPAGASLVGDFQPLFSGIYTERSLHDDEMESGETSRDKVLHSSKSYYDHLAKYYDLFAQRKRSDPSTSKELDFLEGVFKTDATRPVRRVLDVACGGGRHVVGLSQRGYRCVGYDLSQERIAAARARTARAGVSVELKRGDASRLAPGKKFDAVLALYILFLLPSDDDLLKCLAQVHKQLRPGGVLVCNHFNPFFAGKNSLMEYLMSGRNFSESRAPGIRITEIGRLVDFDPVQGVAWNEDTTAIEAPDGRHIFRDRERIRFLTYWDLARYLRDSGFTAIRYYPDWNLKPRTNPKAEQIVFVARR